METAVGFHSLTTTTHPPNVNLPSSGQQVTARLSARKVSVTRGKRTQDPLVRDTTGSSSISKRPYNISSTKLSQKNMGMKVLSCFCLYIKQLVDFFYPN
jgi:hypothetical protein